MYPLHYNKNNLQLTFEDITTVKNHYDNEDGFNLGKHFYVLIKDSDSLLTPNFREVEFLTKCYDKTPHWLDMNLIIALQELRNKYKSPILVTSSFRNQECNNNTPGAATYSQHLFRNAVDFKFLSRSASLKYAKDIKNKKSMFQQLITCHEISGFGSYKNNSYFHIDTRDGADMYIYNNNRYNIWGFQDNASLASGSEYCSE